MTKDVIYNHREKRPEADHYDVYVLRDGIRAYYKRSLLFLMKFEALYGRASGEWSYTNNQADKTY